MIVEYGDFECPHCGLAHRVFEELWQRLSGYFRLAYRHFPLTQVHPHAATAAEASEAAEDRLKFWEMHDLLYTHQTTLDVPHLVELASEIDIETKWFAAQLASHAFSGRVRDDYAGGVRSGVQGTPTLFINGVLHQEAVTVPLLDRAIRKAAEL